MYGDARARSLCDMLYLISYDVASDKRRTRVARCMEAYGERVQYSVFECELSTTQLERLRARLLRLVDHETDSVRIYGLCGGCRLRVDVIGNGTRPDDEAVKCV